MPKESTSRTQKQLVTENEDLRARLDEAEDALRAIRSGEVDALIVSGVDGEQLFTLKGADHSYRILVEDMSEGALTLTAEGVILYANRCFAEMIKTPLEKVIGSSIHTWIAPDSQRILQSLLKKNVDEKSRGQLAITAGDGKLVPVHLSVSNLLVNGMPDSFCLVATDLTEQQRSDAIIASEKLARELLAASKQSRIELLSVIEDHKRAETDLRLSQENFRRSMDESPLGVRVVSKEGETLYANRATLDIFGYDSVEEWKTTPTVKRYTEQSYAEFKVRREKRRLDEDDSPEYNIDIVRKDGEVRHVHIWRKRVLWSGKEHYQVRYNDITERKRTEKQLQVTLDSLRRAVNTTMQVMVSAVETRDPYTSGHQIRSADLARAIATEMGLPQDKIDAIRMAGSIHDIGKLSIPAEILSKPTKLSEIELSLIREHARKGFEMLKDVESPWPLAEIVRQHHERMDGSGYPRNLKGEEILIEARILAVADVVEAMASHRPYRAGLGIDVALSEIEKNRGIFYDSTAADACLRLFREKGFKLEGIYY